MYLKISAVSERCGASGPAQGFVVLGGLFAAVLVFGLGLALSGGCRSTTAGSRDDSSLRPDVKVNAMMPPKTPAHRHPRRSLKRRPAGQAGNLAKTKLPANDTPENQRLLEELGGLSKTVVGDSRRRRPFRPTGNCNSKMKPRRSAPRRPAPRRRVQAE